MRLFKTKSGIDHLLREHLERLGVSPVWLPSVREAIRHCEHGEYFQPVFSVTGPAPARSVVALMRLEPFLHGEIDWGVSPSESPFWVGSVGDLHDGLFSETAERFVDLYWPDRNPAARADLDASLVSMAVTVERALVQGGREPGAEARQAVWSLGAAGYVWRLAETGAQTRDLNLRADLAKEVEAVIVSCPGEDATRERMLAWSAAECLRRNLLHGSGSPGGWASGGEFLRRGFRFADRQVRRDGVELPQEERRYAFSFGVALYDVDECLTRSLVLPPRLARARASA